LTALIVIDLDYLLRLCDLRNQGEVGVAGPAKPGVTPAGHWQSEALSPPLFEHSRIVLQK
jgi:hypothetical protein